ncbi:MAG TPA: helix-turn-helix transcriptional regulator [Candidatus Saccharimonadales bacterium]|jgi:DNA-binding XRE family transcriptional regulator|nr:helix-turn-helix transcriptional regulator [Candidatus Saccharimonadales bacterium]
MTKDPDYVRVNLGAIRHLRQEIGRVKRQHDSVERQRAIFLSELMLTRLEQGMTQAQLARRSGLQQSAIARIENGTTSPTFDTLIKLTRALNRDIMLE